MAYSSLLPSGLIKLDTLIQGGPSLQGGDMPVKGSRHQIFQDFIDSYDQAPIIFTDPEAGTPEKEELEKIAEHEEERGAEIPEDAPELMAPSIKNVRNSRQRDVDAPLAAPSQVYFPDASINSYNDAAAARNVVVLEGAEKEYAGDASADHASSDLFESIFDTEYLKPVDLLESEGIETVFEKVDREMPMGPAEYIGSAAFSFSSSLHPVASNPLIKDEILADRHLGTNEARLTAEKSIAVEITPHKYMAYYKSSGVDLAVEPKSTLETQSNPARKVIEPVPHQLLRRTDEQLVTSADAKNLRQVASVFIAEKTDQRESLPNHRPDMGLQGRERQTVSGGSVSIIMSNGESSTVQKDLAAKGLVARFATDTKLERGLLGEQYPLGSPTSSAVSLTPSFSISSADISRQIVPQINVLVSKPDQAAVEIALNPQELGKVRMSMALSESGVVVNFLTERPETLHLLRRHIDILLQDLRDIGFTNINFSFGQQKSQQTVGNPTPAFDGDSAQNGASEDYPMTKGAAIVVAGLDLRV